MLVCKAHYEDDFNIWKTRHQQPKIIVALPSLAQSPNQRKITFSWLHGRSIPSFHIQERFWKRVKTDEEQVSSLHPEKTWRKKILWNTKRMFRPHGLPQQYREQSGEGRSYIPVLRRDIGAPVPGTVKQVRGSRRSEGIGLTHAHGEGGGVTYRHRGSGQLVPGTVKLVRGEVEEMKRSDWRMRKGKTGSVGIDTGSIETDRITSNSQH